MRKWEIQDAQCYAQGIVVMRERKHFRMRTDMAQGTVVMRQWMIQDGSEPCAFLSQFSLFAYILQILTRVSKRLYCNVAAHSVDSDIFYVVINLSAGSKSYIITFIS